LMLLLVLLLLLHLLLQLSTVRPKPEHRGSLGESCLGQRHRGSLWWWIYLGLQAAVVVVVVRIRAGTPDRW
jgi:hypothetical protein